MRQSKLKARFLRPEAAPAASLTPKVRVDSLKIEQMALVIRGLMDDVDRFARLAAAVDLLDYEFNYFGSYAHPYNYGLGIDFFSIDKKYVEDIEEAYAVLFVRILYFFEEWSIDDKIENDIWLNVLKEFWIPEYHHLGIHSGYSGSEPILTGISAKKAIDDMVDHITVLNENAAKYRHPPVVSPQIIKNIKHDLAQADIITIFGDDCLNAMRFGQTDRLFFICDSGRGYEGGKY